MYMYIYQYDCMVWCDSNYAISLSVCLFMRSLSIYLSVPPSPPDKHTTMASEDPPIES